MNWSKLLGLAVLPALMLASTSALAKYPEKPIRLIVPYAPGGSSDIVGRQLATFLSNEIGATVVVENISGGGGATGVQRAAQAVGDGYTLLLGANSELLINKLLRPELPYDAARDFKPLASVGTGSIVIVGKPSLDASSMASVIEMAKEGQDGLSYGTSGVGTIQHLVGEIIRLRTSAPLTHVAYRGAGPLVSDLAGGHVDLGIATLASVSKLIDAGKVQAYAISAGERTPFAPDIPAISEVPELANITIETWYGIFAPVSIPADIAQILQEKIQTVLRNPELEKSLSQQSIAIAAKEPDELAAFIVQENEKYKNIIAQAKISVQ
ncbi:MAG: tripartite tricarboxylate transporter substrate binding protein [Pusillimonas sp.]